MKRSLVALLFATTFVLTSSATTSALQTPSSIQETIKTRLSTIGEPKTAPVEGATAEEKKKEFDARKAELEQKLADKRAAISEKLTGPRAERCKFKQLDINSMLDNRVGVAQKHLEKLQGVHQRLITLVDEKEIAVENRTALERVMTSREGMSQGSIGVLKDTNFKCEGADSVAPGAIIKDQISVAKQDLKNYRDSIKDFAEAIKTAIAASKEAESTENASAQETPNTEQSAEGVQP